MFFLKDSALKAHLKHNVPANLWYITSHNGVSMFAHARFVEEKIDKVRKNLNPGQVLRPTIIEIANFRQVMYFTDRTELRTDVRRTVPGVAGSIAEFNRLCDLFPTMHGPNLYVNCTRTAGWNEYGTLTSPDDFVHIVNAAKGVISVSVAEFGK